MTGSIIVDFGVWNAGRTHGMNVKEAQRVFDENCTKVQRNLRKGFLMAQEFDEADTALEHPSAAHIFGQTHKWIQFKQATPSAVPDQFRISTKPVPTTVKMSEGIARWSPHRVMTKADVVLRDDEACRFIVASTHIMRHKKGEADKFRALHISRLRAQFRAAEKRGIGMVLGLDGNDPDLPELHPNQKVLYHNRIDYIIALDGKDLKFEKKRTRVVDTNIDNHNLGIATTKISWK
jgi:hypothetical protein